MVATAFPDATEAGAAMLRAGGNAMDAACASAWALAVCEPGESGLGGQTTMLVRRSDGTMLTLDGHSHGPSAVSRKKLRWRDQKRGIRSCVVPSTVLTLGEAHRRFGVLPLATVMGPAIRLASEGWVMTAGQRRLFKWTRPFVKKGSAEEAFLFKADGTLFDMGEVFRQPALTRTLERVAREGVRDFYDGSIAREIVEDMEARGGLVTAEDLRTLVLPVDRKTASIMYRGHRVVSIPPPGGGIQVLLALQMLQQMLSEGMGEASWEECLAEATWASFVERERWPDHPKNTPASMVAYLTSAERAAKVVKEWRETRAQADERMLPLVATAVPRDSMGEIGNTTHLCTADDRGMVVSLTQSIQSVFGSKTMHPTLGFVYNNYLATCPRDSHPYRLASKCLPQSNAAPTIIFGPDGGLKMALGSAGSRRITSSVVRVISAVIDRGRPLAEALAMPRAHALLSRTLWMEKSMAGESQVRLSRRFPKVRLLAERSYKAGAVQAIAWDLNGAPTGAADPRRDGSAIMVTPDNASGGSA